MKRFGSTCTALAVAAATAMVTYSVAMAGTYDFELGGDKNNLRKAYLMCSFKRFQEGDCPDVYKECQKPWNLSWTGKSTCQKAPKFGDKNKDADQALNDGAEMSKTADSGTAVAHDSTANTSASNLDETASSDTPCTASADETACNDALANDAAGESAYDTSGATLTAATSAATSAGQTGVVDSIASSGTTSTDSSTADTYVYDAELDGPILDLSASTTTTETATP